MKRGGLAWLGGFTLIELLVYVVVISLALAAVLRVFAQASLASADPQVRRQALAVAESLLEEVSLMPFTFCDADDPNAATASSAAGCINAETMGAEPGETRYASPQFDHVNDYNGFTMTGIRDISNTAVSGLEGYSASVAVNAATLGDITSGSGDALAITVTVNGPGNVVVKLQGHRTRHSPNAAL